MSIYQTVIQLNEATDSWSYDSETSWTHLVDVLASGQVIRLEYLEMVVYLDVQITAENYNADADLVDDSLCEYALVQGCMDEAACNYDSEAEQDNGSCTYAAEGLDCDGNCLSGELLVMNDSYGDGWNGAVLTINGEDYTVH